MRTYHCFWLLFWAGQPHQSFLTPLSKRTSGFPEKEKVLVLSGNSRQDLHRSKRSWMWNQFFLLEEYTGTDYQYVGKVSYFHMHLCFDFRSTGKPALASREEQCLLQLLVCVLCAQLLLRSNSVERSVHFSFGM